MPSHQDSHGKIEISPLAVSTIVSHAINQCYGVVGMASKNLADGIAQLLSRDSHKGIEVQFAEDGSVIIDVYVIVEYGTRIRVVAESIQNTVKFHVEKAIGLSVQAINVYVHGLRLSNQTEAKKSSKSSKKRGETGP